MPTKELLVDIGNYLEGNYDMGGGVGKVVDETTKFVDKASGDRLGHTDLESQGRKIDKHYADQTNVDEQLRAGTGKIQEEMMKGPGEKHALWAVGKMGEHWINEASNFLAGDPRGHNRKQEQKRQQQKQMQDLQDKLNAASQSYGQDKAKKKKKKGLLAMNTPSAKASRFRSGKRRFRVRPGSATGVNVGGASGSASVGTS